MTEGVLLDWRLFHWYWTVQTTVRTKNHPEQVPSLQELPVLCGIDLVWPAETGSEEGGEHLQHVVDLQLELEGISLDFPCKEDSHHRPTTYEWNMSVEGAGVISGVGAENQLVRNGRLEGDLGSAQGLEAPSVGVADGNT